MMTVVTMFITPLGVAVAVERDESTDLETIDRASEAFVRSLAGLDQETPAHTVN